VSDQVLVDRPADGLAVVTLNRPAKYNALTPELLDELSNAFDRLGEDADLRAVVLTGADPAFCAGIDLGRLSADAARFSAATFDSLRALHVPIIGAINGVAVTGGLELALACDLRVASDQARFADTHARVGVLPLWGLSAALPAAVGQSWARQMSFTGNFVDAELALRIGLVNEVVPHNELLARVLQLAADITTADPGSVRGIKRLYDVAAAGTAADALRAEVEKGPLQVAENFGARRDALLRRGKQQLST
jgi:enoyl-CoA hydratase